MFIGTVGVLRREILQKIQAGPSGFYVNMMLSVLNTGFSANSRSDFASRSILGSSPNDPHREPRPSDSPPAQESDVHQGVLRLAERDAEVDGRRPQGQDAGSEGFAVNEVAGCEGGVCGNH